MKLLEAAEWAAYQGEFIGLWTDASYAYALYEPDELVAVSLQNGAYPALSYPGADWFQCLTKDLTGHVALGFQAAGTAIEQFREPDGRAAWPDFSGPEDEGVHQVALGPVYGDITEPAHFRIFALGERILKLQIRQGYAHRGVRELMRGKSPRQAARYAARISGDATVAHSIAFARAAETALGVEAPLRAHFLRAIMAEVERLSNHCGDLAEIAKIICLAPLESRCALLKELLADAAQLAFGNRLMMDIVIPGGVAIDITEAGPMRLLDVLESLDSALAGLREAFIDMASLQDRIVGIGVISPALAAAYNAGGYVGRASAKAHDARVEPGYPPYTAFGVAIPVEQTGDIAARIRVRLAEMAVSTGLIRQFLLSLQPGPLALVLPVESGIGLGVAESFRGPVWHWLKIDNGHIQDNFVVDASVPHWALLEQVAPGANLADFSLIERSINPSCAGVDG